MMKIIVLIRPNDMTIMKNKATCFG